MGETRDELEANGGPGMFLCGAMGIYVSCRCNDCAHCVATGCEHCKEECPEWQPEEEPRYD